LERLFQTLGFTENEVAIYLSLAESGGATANDVSKASRVPRTTTYSVLETLIKKGLVSQERSGEVTLFVANKPTSLLTMIQRERAEITRKENAAKQLIERVAPLFGSGAYKAPKLQFFEGRESVENMLYEFTDAWHSSMAQYDSTWWGYQDASFVEQYLDWLRWSWERRPAEQQIWLFSNEAPVEDELRGKVAGRRIRTLPAQIDFESTIWICGDHIVFLRTERSRTTPFRSARRCSPRT
jgi:DNA-binding MarR family transcriptional regulator